MYKNNELKLYFLRKLNDFDRIIEFSKISNCEQFNSYTSSSYTKYRTLMGPVPLGTEF